MNATVDLHALGTALAEGAAFPAWLAGYRVRSTERFNGVHFPERKTEAWKYTSLHALATSGALATRAAISDATVPATALPVLDAWRMVFVNGRYNAAQSLLPNNSMILALPLMALPDAEQESARTLLDLTATADAKRLPFAALNHAAFADGLYIRIGKDAKPAKPLHVIFHTTGNAPATAQTRLLVRLDSGAQLTLIEQYTGTDAGMLTNAATTIDLARDAQLTHARVQLNGHAQFHIGSLYLRQQANSRHNGYYFMTGSRLTRNDITCEMAEPGAELNLQGAFLAGSGEHIDNQICIEHAAPHCTSNQVFKGLAGGDGRAVFNGRIHIHPGAKQTSAELVNNNLLLSADAEIDTKPELEIYNDDVKCAHGATVGQLNEAGVFYLQSRGIAKADAELILSLGFVNALIDTLPLPALADWLREQCAHWFTAHGGRA